MNVAVRYYSQTGNTKKLAETIANAVGTTAQTTDVPISDETDILFLGASVYWAGIDHHVKQFIASLDKNKVKKVAVFSTSALAERAFSSIEKLLNNEGISVIRDNFYCRGEFKFMHKGRPNAQDLKDAKEFAVKIIHG